MNGEKCDMRARGRYQVFDCKTPFTCTLIAGPSRLKIVSRDGDSDEGTLTAWELPSCGWVDCRYYPNPQCELSACSLSVEELGVSQGVQRLSWQQRLPPVPKLHRCSRIISAHNHQLLGIMKRIFAKLVPSRSLYPTYYAAKCAGVGRERHGGTHGGWAHRLNSLCAWS
jgi:hypothetical protein